MTDAHKRPSPHDAALAKASGQLLARYVGSHRSLHVQIQDAEQEQSIELPASAVEMLSEILEVMSTGHAVHIIPENAELTTVQTAEILNVSRPFVIKLMEEGVLPHRKVGKHRRIRMDDVIAYKTRIDRERERVLDELAATAQKEKMGYHAV
jgi:excisionase family DNA binding protein